MTTQHTGLQLQGINKRFGQTQALNDVSIEIAPGEIHAIVGENGAGKSTMGKVIAGIYSADDGTMILDGKTIEKWNISTAQRHGVAMIAQELALVPDLTVAQNVFLGVERHVLGIEKRDLNERFAQLVRTVGFHLDPKQKVRDLRIADQQKVEILRAIARDAHVLVMDEPTSSLTAQEMTQLEELMQSLADSGRAIIYVSHFLDSVLRISDRITVMRDGRRISTVDGKSVAKNDLVAQMLGRELENAYPDRPSPPDPSTAPILEVEDLVTDTGVNGMSLNVRPGEIVGLLGLVGSGRTEALRAVFGMDPVKSGTVVYAGKRWTGSSPRASLDAGLVLVSEDRHKDGLVLQRSVRENIALSSLGNRQTAGIIHIRQEKRVTRLLAVSMELRPLNLGLSISGFSGGNQQKAMLGKALAASPKVVILDEPTRGVDVGAKRTIYDLIVRLAGTGVGVVLISSEHEEIMELAHRAYLVSDGKTIGEVNPSESTLDDVLYRLFNVEDIQEQVK
jgi:ribose transport system ATP-binding protein